METCLGCDTVIGGRGGAERTFLCMPCRCPLCFGCAAWSVNETEACVNCGVPATGMEALPRDAEEQGGPIVIHSSDSESAASETDEQDGDDDLDTSDGDTESSAASGEVSEPESDASDDSTGSLFEFGVPEEPLRPVSPSASQLAKRPRSLEPSD